MEKTRVDQKENDQQAYLLKNKLDHALRPATRIRIKKNTAKTLKNLKALNIISSNMDDFI